MPRLSKIAISIRKCEALAEHQVIKAFICLCFDEEDSSEDDIDNRILVELAVLKALRYCLRGPYRQWDSNWKRMLEDGTYMSNDEFLSNFHMD
jgi:hypothetical protein